MSSIYKTSHGIVLYDFFRTLGGAERVAAELVNYYHADIALGFDKVGEQLLHTGSLSNHKFDFAANCSFLPFQLMRLVYVFYYKAKFVNNYDWVIYSGNYAPLAVRHQKKGKRILYCHTPLRFIYDLKSYYEDLYSGFMKPLLALFVDILKPLYENAFHSMDIILANSENVKKRIEHYLGTNATVVHPPCPVEGKVWNEPQGYYLSLARLEHYKRVDLLVKAFMKMPDKKLVVASGGSEYEKLKFLAAEAKNIYFTGWLPQDELDKLISHCIASLYIPIDEDFGMSPVESMAAGKPVIGVEEGGLLETVIPGETGILISSPPHDEAIIEAVGELTSLKALTMKDACQQRAQLFNKSEFFRKIDKYLQG